MDVFSKIETFYCSYDGLNIIHSNSNTYSDFHRKDSLLGYSWKEGNNFKFIKDHDSYIEFNKIYSFK